MKGQANDDDAMGFAQGLHLCRAHPAVLQSGVKRYHRRANALRTVEEIEATGGGKALERKVGIWMRAFRLFRWA